ncbi:MTRF1L release factor glutamine methyltransferase [Discoglossus pictus]
MRLSPLSLHKLLRHIPYSAVPCRRLVTGEVTPVTLAQHWERVFQSHGVPEPRESSEILISHVLGAKTFPSLPPSLVQTPIPHHQLTYIERLAKQRLQRVPVQYIIGEWDFLDMTLQMRPPVFIPRPETEELVGLVARSKLQYSADPIILEVGCGSGAVSLALLRSLPQARVIAVDKTEAAVSLSRDNAERLGLLHRIHILQHNILTDTPDRLLEWGPLDAVVSNPPYIFTEDMSQLDPEILSYEDHAALHGGPDGMDVIKGILLLAPRLLKHDGDVFLEGDPRHPNMVQESLQKYPGEKLQLISIVQDFCGKSRFIHLRMS